MKDTKASTILYASGFLLWTVGFLIPVLAILSSMPLDPLPDTVIELIEWNPFTQLGLICFIVGAWHFLLGLLTDHRGA